jgi:hypothetical protein
MDTLLIAPYVELVDHIIAGRACGPIVVPAGRGWSLKRRSCVCRAQVLLRFYDERHWMRAARGRVGTCFRG